MLSLLFIWLVLGVGQEARPFPPDHCFLLQGNSEVTLRWPLSGDRFQVQTTVDGHPIFSGQVQGHQLKVQASPGKLVHWTVTNPITRQSHSAEFTVASERSYHADGKDFGFTPGSGDAVRARLGRDQDGMHLLLEHRRLRRHYLSTQPGVRFQITCRGSNGADGMAGYSAFDPDLPVNTKPGPGFNHPIFREGSPGEDGLPGGRGGIIRVITDSAPWRDYLDLDVSGGRGGKGGKGGREGARSEKRCADGLDGANGPPGKVETKIEPSPISW